MFSVVLDFDLDASDVFLLQLKAKTSQTKLSVADNFCFSLIKKGLHLEKSIEIEIQ